MDVRVHSHDGETSFYVVRYADLRNQHREMCALTDEEFSNRLPEAAHLACVIGWLKELPSDATVGDAGIVHELVHLICGTYSFVERDLRLAQIRAQFADVLRLA